MSSERTTGEWSVVARQQQAIARVGNLGLRGVEFDRLLGETLDAVSSSLAVDAAILFELADDVASLTIVGAVVDGNLLRRDDLGAVTIPAGLDSLPGYTVQQDDVVEAPDLLADPRFRASAPDFGIGLRSAVAGQVGWGERPWGVLCGYTYEPRAWTDDDRHFVQSIATTLGLAIYRREAEAALVESSAREYRARVEAELARERLMLLGDLSVRLMSTLDPDAVLRAFPDVCVPRLGDVCIVDLVDEAGDWSEVAAAGVRQADLDAVRSPSSDDRGPFGRAGSSTVVSPLVVRGVVVGALTVSSTAASARTYGDEDVALVRDMADRIALAHDHGLLFESRNRVARSLQAALLPPALPSVRGLELSAGYRVAEDDFEIGGDFYDVIEMGERVWGVVVGDVCGRGPEAAALTGLVRHSVRAAVVREQLPSRVLAQTNDAVLDQIDDARFCTATYLRLEVGEPGTPVRLVASSAGHPPPMVLRADGRAEVVPSQGALLGVVPSPNLVDVEVALGPGDAVVLYTDGVTEARHGAEQFGEERLLATLESAGGATAQGIVDAVMARVQEFAGGTSDDRAVVVVRADPAATGD
jgi:serine phosphatase RsbU (regulator of sigma subunit)